MFINFLLRFTLNDNRKIKIFCLKNQHLLQINAEAQRRRDAEIVMFFSTESLQIKFKFSLRLTVSAPLRFA